MAQAQKGNSVNVHYTGVLDDGTIFDSNIGGEPFAFVIGSGQVIAGFDEAVIGMEVGEKRTTRIPAGNAYGAYRDDLVLEVSREHIPAEIRPEEGLELELQDADGQRLPVVISEVSDETVKLDANHPLAGEDLTFEIELLSIG